MNFFKSEYPQNTWTTFSVQGTFSLIVIRVPQIMTIQNSFIISSISLRNSFFLWKSCSLSVSVRGQQQKLGMVEEAKALRGSEEGGGGGGEWKETPPAVRTQSSWRDSVHWQVEAMVRSIFIGQLQMYMYSLSINDNDRFLIFERNVISHCIVELPFCFFTKVAIEETSKILLHVERNCYFPETREKGCHQEPLISGTEKVAIDNNICYRLVLVKRFISFSSASRNSCPKTLPVFQWSVHFNTSQLTSEAK